MHELQQPVEDQLFKKEYLEKCIKGQEYFEQKKCSVTGKSGEHCPEMPVIQIDNICLCAKCLDNLKMGAYLQIKKGQSTMIDKL